MKKRPTITDVARHAGVSKASVSYVLNDVKKVSQSTKERVLMSIEELGYEPDFTAVSLTRQRSQLIGIILPLVNQSIAHVMRENTYYNEMISAVEQRARESGFDVLLTGLSRPEHYRTWVHKRKLDGLLFFGLFPKEIYDEMRSIDVPAVLIDTYEEHTDRYPSVNIEDEKGAYLATCHLAELGHSRILFTGTNLHNPVEHYRYTGYERACKEAGIQPMNPVETPHSHSFLSGYEAAERVSATDATAVFCTSDIIAQGLIRALYERGIRVPDDLSVAGFDDIHSSRYSIPSLTTIRQQIQLKGDAAAGKLLEAMKGGSPEPEVLDVSLIIRESTAPPDIGSASQ
ncbi:LacI family DNA-binding transcriptional regulator [Bacillus daqingensis]